MTYNKSQTLKNNVEAIDTVLRLRQEGREANEVEHFLLSQYSGFGGLKFILNPASSIEDKQYWKHADWSYFDKVRDLYDIIHYYSVNENEEREFIDSIKRSVNTAFYTPSYTIDGVVKALSDNNIKITTLLDPSAGIGKFGESFRKRNKDIKVTSFEKDLLTGQILKALYPQDDVHIDGFETIDKSMEGKFDVVASNIPFGNISVFDPSFNDSKNEVRRSATKAIHNYFFLKALDQVRDGGFVMFITSRGVMDSPSNADVRREMLDKADLVTAIRLPDGMFLDEAGTEVGSDLIVLQKNPINNGLSSDEKDFVRTQYSKDNIIINEYFITHKDHIITTGGMIGTDAYGKPAYIYPFNDSPHNLSNFITELLSHDLAQSQADVLYYGFKENSAQLSPEVKSQSKVELSNTAQSPKVEAGNNNATVSRIEKPAVISRPQTQSRSRGRGKKEIQGGPIQLDLFADWNEQEFQLSNTQVTESQKPLVSMEPRSFDGDKKAFYRDGITVEESSTKQLGVLSSRCSVFTPVSFDKEDESRMRQYILIRDAYNELYSIEAETRTEHKELREELNRQYDSFVLKYGRLNERRNSKVVLLDIMGRDCLTLENPVGKGFEKADIFNRPVSFIAYEIEHVDTPEEALFASLNRYGVVNLEYMSDITSHSEEELIDLLKGRIYYNPTMDDVNGVNNLKDEYRYETAEHFLSGNIYQKLERLESFISGMENVADNPMYIRVKESVEALRKAIPEQISFDDIGLQFGERWIPLSYYEEYVGKLFDTKVEIHYAEHIDEYSVKPESRYGNLKISEEYCVRGEYKSFDGMDLLLHAFHDTTPNIQKCIGYDSDGNDLKGPDMEKIQLAQSKIQEIREGFTDFLTNLPKKRRDDLQSLYNRKFNCFVKARYDGTHQTFPGIDLKALASPRFNVKDIYKSQKDCVWMLLQNGGGICDHEVGTGKTLIMCMAAHEMHRLGIANKPLIIAMKANVAEIAATYQAAFPDDKILYASEKDYAPANRLQFFNRIKNNDYACVVMSHDQFYMIPQSLEVQEQIVRDEIRDLDEAIQVIRNEGGNVSGRMLSGLEKRKENLQVKMRTLQHDMQNRKDDFVDFGLMGIDHIFVDESHQFKNLMFTTRHERVSGLGNPKGSQKALNLLYAIRTIQGRTGKDLGATFLSGTTISNSLTELYLLFKYLRPKALADQGIHSFDSWAAVYAKKTSDYEFSVTNAVVQKERFRYFVKVPELATFYNEITDYRTGEDVGLDRPAKNIILHNIQPTADQQDFNERLMKFAQSGDGELIFRAPLNDREMKSKMLIATDVSRKAALDMRLVSQELFTDNPGNKASHCARLVAEYYNKYNEQKGTQFIFSDLSTYKPGEWNVFQEIKDKLVNDYNIPESEIRFIQEAKNQNQRKAIIEAMNRGEVRVLFGSTTTLGTGVNAQKRAVAVHHIDIPWRPSDLEQRDGRARRSGNEVAKLYADNNVDIIIYAVERTLDSYKFNLLQNKQIFINQLKTNSLGTRVVDEGAMDEENGMNFAEYVAILSGNDDLLQKAKLEKKVLALESERKTYMQARRDTEYRLEKAKSNLSDNEKYIKYLKEDNEAYLSQRKVSDDGTLFPGLKIKNVPEYIAEGVYNVEGLGTVLQNAGRTIGYENHEVGTVYGFPLKVESVYEYESYTGKQNYVGNKFWVEGHIRYEYNYGKLALSKDNRQAAVNYGVNALEKIPSLIKQHEDYSKKLRSDIVEYERIAGKAWNKEEELKTLHKELDELEKKIQASLEVTNASLPKPEELSYKISKEGNSHKVTYQRKSYPLVSVTEMKEFARPGGWRNNGYVSCTTYRDKVMVSTEEVVANFSSRYAAEKFVEKLTSVSEQRENDTSWIIDHARQDVADDINIATETIHSARHILEERGINWHQPVIEEADAVEVQGDNKVEENNDEKTLQVYSVGKYGEGEKGEELRRIAHQVKEFGSDSSVQMAVTQLMGIFNQIPAEEKKRMVLIAMPGTTGYADYMKKVVDKLSESTYIKSFNILNGTSHDSLYDLKKNGVKYEDLPEIRFSIDNPLSKGTIAVLVDNVLDTGRTLSQAIETDFGEGVEVRAAVLAHTDNYKEHNANFNVKTVDDLKKVSEVRKEDKEQSFAAAVEKFRSEHSEDLSAHEKLNVARLLNISWNSLFGKEKAQKELADMGIDWRTGGAMESPSVKMHSNSREVLTNEERSLLSQIAMDLETGNHLLGYPRPAGYQDMMKELHDAFEAVGNWELTAYQASLLKEMSKNYHDGYSDLASVIGVEESILRHSLTYFETHPRGMGYKPYFIYDEEDGRYAVDYPNGFGFSEDYANILANAHHGEAFRREGRLHFYFDDIQSAADFVETVDKEAVRIDRKISVALDKKLEEAGIKVHLNTLEAQQILGAKYMFVPTGNIFISNARRVVESIQQSKATPDQWLRMIDKRGGIKSGEDRWTGLSEWLRDSKERTLTKHDILEYISEHQIQINESHYSESFDILDFVDNVIEPKFEKYQEEVIADERDAMISKRGESYTNMYFDSYIYNRREKIAQAAFDRMVEEYGEDFRRTFYLSVPQGDRYQLSIKNNQYIAGLIKEGERPVNPIRLRYTTPGLTNKKELALSVPTIMPYSERDYIHFGDADSGRAIAWVRFGDYVDMSITGKEERVLVIDEIQSYRHQEGRAHGYATVDQIERVQDLEELISDSILERDSYSHFLINKYNGQLKLSDIEDLLEYGKKPLSLLFSEAERDHYYNLIQRVNERVELLNVYKTEYHIDNYSVPVAPFEKNWHELVMKRMLRYAVENGYDRIAWTKGVQQSERYNIGYALDNIYIEDIYTSPDDNEIHRYLHVGFKDQLNTFFTVDVNKDGIAILDKDDFNENLYNKLNGEHISKIFGNHLAEQIMNSSKGEKISGIGIHIDGEGMSAFYDNIIPGFMDKYCKKWGVAVHDTEVVDDIMHGVDITDGMRDDLRQSQPMFFRANDREVYGFVHDGEIYIDDNIATAETRLHERAHLFAAVMREKNPEEWQNIVNMMKDTPEVWNYVRREYPHLHTDDEIADEALAQFSGRHGLKKLQDFANGYDDAETIFGKVSAALSKFWKFVCDFFEMHYTSKEEVADRILYDTLNGVKLPELQNEVSDQYHFVGKTGAANIDSAIGGLNIRMMERAEQLEQGGSSPLDIKIETGWERGADGQWMMEIPGFRSFDPYGNTEWLQRHSDVRRYLQLLQKQSSYQYGIGEALSVEEQSEFDRLKELDDVKNYHSRITQKNSDMLSVGDYIDAPLLFAAYSGLSSMAVRVEEMEDRGSFNTRQSIIDGSDVHYIQLNKEMVEKARGFELTSYNEMQSILAHEIQHYIQFQEGFPCGIGFSLLRGDLADKMVQYRKNAGEVQSRVVQYRIGMTIQERRQSLSEDYEDVPRGQQIFTYDSVIAAFRDADNYLDEQYISDVRYQRDVMSETDVDNNLFVSLIDRLSSMGIEVVTDSDVIKAELDVTTKPFKDGEGKVYGFTKNGKIYIDSAIATAETPIHEYAHLWVTVLRESSPNEWENVKNLMKGTMVWDEISRRYNDLSDEDAIADEVIATYSGRRGAELLRKEVSKSIVNGTIDKSNAYAIFDNVRSALGYFWSKISEIFGLSYVTPDDVADMVLMDFLDGRNPVAYTNSRIDEILNDDKLRFHFIGETGAARIDESNKDSHLLDSLSKAKEMTVTNEDSDSIKSATGWETGVDGKWRYAIEFATLKPESPWSKYFVDTDRYQNLDLLGKIDESVKVYRDIIKTRIVLQEQKLGDTIENESLFTAYPDLKDINVVTFISESSVYGNYNQNNNTIGVNLIHLTSFDDISSNKNGFLSILAHEIQHAIQSREGFAIGGNRSMMEVLYSAAQEEREVRAWVRELKERAKTYDDKSDYEGLQQCLVREFKEDGGEWFLPSEDIMSKGLEYFKHNTMNMAMDPVMEALNVNKSTGAEFDSQKFYERLAGEQEAFAVQDRFEAGYDEHDQRSIPTKYDVDPKEQIVLHPEVEDVIFSISESRTLSHDERRLTPADREAGGAIVDHLEKMGINVHTDLKEYRHAMKAAEKDNSQEGNVRYFTTESGKRYGFSYKGEMYLDLRKVDAELPLNQYARLWCQTMQKVNPEGWANIVATLKNDHESWDFAHRRFGDISSDDTLLAEEIICSYSGRRGAGKLQEELKRMSSKDESYSSRWGNIFNNISKVIQDFWKHTGDSLNINYKNVDDIADMILMDFATKVNPVKKMENWLKDRDKEYAEAVASGDMGKAYSLFNAALQEHVGNGITPYVAVDGYRGRMDRLARNVKSDNPVVREEAINEAADRMTPLLRTYNADNAVLVPAPSHIGYATDMLSLANAISERTGIQVADVLKSDSRESQYNAKKETGKALSSEQLGIRKEGELPEGKLPIVIDNVVNSGNTAKACVDALGGGIVLAVASAVTQSRHVSTLKSAEPVLYDKNNHLVPLSERFEFKNKHLASVQGMPSDKPIPYQEPDIIQGLESYDIEDIRAYVENSVQEVLDLEYPDKDIYIKQVTIIGSRARGEGHEDSDLDILLEYGGNDVREDSLFNVLNNEENKVSLEGIEFDINPINAKRSLSTAEWLARDEKWREKDLSMDNNNKQNNIMDKNEQKEQLQAKQKDLLKSFTGIKSVYENEVVLLRQKGFMETFGKDAELASEQFDVPLYERTIGDEKLPFALVSYEKYVERIGEVDVDLHIVSNPVELEIMEEITPFISEISTEEKENVDLGRSETLTEEMKRIMESAIEDELQDGSNIGSDRVKELEGSKDKVLGLFDGLVSITNDDNGLLAQFGRTHDLVNELGLLYVPITLRVPVVVNHSKEEIVEDWRLEDDKAIITDVTFTNEDCKIYKSFLNAYDDENGFSITDLPFDKWKEVLDLVEEQLNDQDRQITVYVDTKQVPDWALPAMVNGEADGLSDEEEDMVNKFMEQYKGCIYSPRDESPSFNNSPAFGLATDTIPVDIVRISTPRQLREEQQEKTAAGYTGQVGEDTGVETPAEVKEDSNINLSNMLDELIDGLETDVKVHDGAPAGLRELPRANLEETIKFVLNGDSRFRYQMLSRMQTDVKYYLGAGNHHDKDLWAGNARDHIAIMDALMRSLPEQPVWLTREMFEDYANQMGVSDVLSSAENKQENSEMVKEPEPLSAEDQKAADVVEQPKEEEKKPKSKWDNLDYTKYTLPEGVVVENAKVTRIPPKEGEKYAKFVISADALGKHYSKEMWGNDIKAYYEKDEYGKRTNRVALDQLVAKYFGKQFADSMSIGSVQEAEHVLSEQKEEKLNAAESAEQKQQVQSDKDMEEQKAVEQKKAEEEAARKKAEEEKKNDKKEKVPAVLIQSTLIMNALLSAKEHDGQWLNRDGKTSPDFVQGGQSVSPFNALMMALHSDANGYKTNIYTTFNAARSNKCSVRSGQSGLPFNWYNWDKYVNRFNSNEVISKDEYENLPDQEKELFKVLRSKEERSVFNIDQTTMPNVQSAEYDAILEKQNNEQSKLKESPEKEDSEKYTSVYKQYSFFKEKHSDAVLLYRCGDFYETYMGDAEKVSKLLNLNVIESPDKKDFDGNWLKTVGFPYHALDTYLPKLIRVGCRVAICEKLDDPRQNKRFGVADTIYSKSNELIDSLKKYDNVIVDTLSESFYNSEKDMLHFNNSRKSLLGAEVTTAIERFNDVCRASVGYTGGESRLNRIGSSKMLPEDAVKYDRLVQELASGVMMVREGYPATLSDESIEMIPYWERELKESPLLIENIEKDVNNAVEVLEKMKNNEAIDYGSIRGEKSFDAMRPKLYTIATELAKLPNVDTKTVVIVKDDKTKSAAVILPAGASLEVNNEIPGMNKNRFVIGLKRQGYENIQFFNSGGSLGLKQSNEFFADKTVEISRLKQYDIVNLETLDLSAEIDRTSRVDIENVSMTRDDKGNYLLYVKPVESESFTVYPERNDIKKFFDSIRTKDFDNVRETLGQKYYGLVLRHPDLKCNELMPDIIDGIDLSRITKVNITKDKYKPNTTIIFATIDGEKQKPVELNSVQAQRFWLVNDQDMYKLSLAAQIWQDKLSVDNGQSEDGQAQFHNYSEGQGADIGSSSVEEKDDVQVQAQDNKKGGGLRV